ncbi:hypothetical protein QWY87_16455 [Lutimonas halocynthiae]|uniref:hypothetical protein n=1 Tax=Lutimonas halocynthiae TaxID=1446477 RepID=UPI0025B43967|nr:hypothetical protein [Lutimonas halocynthiae]MDN3644308.1 hypothetical protein [Lutimonas halocynthiae]
MEDMKTRFTLYGIGFAIGIALVFFFLGGKKASCNWLPNDRILNIIQQKQISYSQTVNDALVTSETDSLDIMLILTRGDIDFSKSQVKNDPCRNYWIEGINDQKDLFITVEVCDSTAVVKTLEKKMPKK